MASKDIGVDNARVSRLCATIFSTTEALWYQHLRDFARLGPVSGTSSPVDTEVSR